FGAGYANFENLLKLHADFIKIDGSLIKQLAENQDAYDIVESIVSFAKKKDIQTIAEFVSSADILEKVRQLHIDYAQGYFIGQPDKTPLLADTVIRSNTPNT
ncbi:MAG: EAL domain-containing protein, partial [Hydrogenovibrio sp.]